MKVRERLNRFKRPSRPRCSTKPSTMSGFHCGASRYFLLPGRLHRWKRVGPGDRSYAPARRPLRSFLSRALARTEGRVPSHGRVRTHVSVFLGRVSDAELIQLYADTRLGSSFVPPARGILELVTLEAFLSSKPVVTCTDSGEPCTAGPRRRGRVFVTPPTSAGLAAAMGFLVRKPGGAPEAMGRQGRPRKYRTSPGTKVSETLMTAFGLYTGS